MVTLEPNYRIDVIANAILPGICHDFSEDVWDYQESINKIDHYRTVGQQLAQRFDDNLYALEALEEAYTKAETCLERIQEQKELEKTLVAD